MKLRWAMAAMIAAAMGASACSDDEGGSGPVCPENQILCGDQCINVNTDWLNCGACGTACSPGEVCMGGDCATDCQEGLTDCNGGCRDLDTDELHCGECDNACMTGESCADGACTLVCPSGQTACSGACVDTTSDGNNCGGCGVVCEADEVCANGACEFTCPDGFSDCSGSCRDTSVDRNNCGACGNACGPEELCVDSVCTLSCDGGAPDECNGACTDTQIDPANCGACGVVCAGSEVCDIGACSLSCSPSLTACGQTCTSTLTDVNNCGACGTACTVTVPGAASVCVDGGCFAACRSGFDDCNDDLVLPGGDGCETDLLADIDNCGACGQTCDIANGAGACTVGQCLVTACDTGFDDCNGAAADGCEAELDADDANCGACGNACTGGDVCLGGTCQAAVGEDCSVPITLRTGTSTYAWAAFNADYILTNPDCVTIGDVEGPDVVFTYTSTITGLVTIDMDKPTSNRYVFVVSDSTCGMASAADTLLCVSEWSPATMGGSFAATAGTTYYIYFRDTDSGSQPLPNPLSLTVSIFQPPCIPGQNGMVGSTVTRLATGLTVSTEYYVAADTSTSGYVYVGGLTQLERLPKAGGAVEDVVALAGLTNDNLGYEMLIDGDDIYTIESTTTGTTGRVYRISSDGGATWNVFDAVTFPTSPSDDLRASEAYNGRVYLLTQEGSASEDTEVWSFPSGTATATTAQLEVTFAEENCSGLAVDDTYFYAACGDGERLVRVDRGTGSVTLVTTDYDMSGTNNSLYGVDQDGDGAVDFLYLQTWYEEGYFVCNPGRSDQFTGPLFDFGGSSSNYGLGFDGAARLYAFDDDNEDVIIVE